MAIQSFDFTAAMTSLRKAIALDERTAAEAGQRIAQHRGLLKDLERRLGSQEAVKQMRVAPGSLADRILSACREPQPLAIVVEAVKARAEDVKAEMTKLVKAGRVVRTGHTTSTRYTAK